MIVDHAPSNPAVEWNDGWQVDAASVDRMARIAPGTTMTVVKRSPDGHEAARYPAVRVETDVPAPWIELVAEWTVPDVCVAGLDFVPGDAIREFFSALHPYNAFAVMSPAGELRGWYGNVTYPAFIEEVDGKETLVWHDLYLDAVILPDGATHLLDDDELAESGLAVTNPRFAEAIVAAREDLVAFIRRLDGGNCSST